MRWSPLIVALSLVYVGCGPRRPPAEEHGRTPAGPVPGGSVRAYFDDSDLVRVTTSIGDLFVPGPEPDVFERSDRETAGGPWLDAVRFIDPEGADPVILAGLGQIDLAVVYGRDAARMLDVTRETGGLMTRLPRRDRTYVLWLHPGPGRRWTRDPAFRTWLRERIDREAIVDYLFGGEAVPVEGLLQGASDTVPVAATTWRVPSGIRPRVSLTFHEGDPNAAALASRIKAVVDGHGVAVDLEGVEMATFLTRVRDQQTHAALLVIRSPSADPILELQEVLRPLGEPVLDALEVLDRGNRESPGSARRAAAAREAERLVIDGDGPGRYRLVPLVRVHAWLFTAPGLRGVARGDPAELSLGSAWWEP
jgi:hypothetical protein